ncbi:Receptor-like cytosolic serine/threonine-protein kinase RBK2 [Hibiscus syriacus]|uniref:non-specific serine/threonine protein kinase n=1 Tax=Hibiscus syriacus TaxID=106335 RepID=A0A6A3BMV9_HIBSY|nr:Receptor-like cytosolic serine/threonine-protein kinase RBK2 [Hibiscus syriacus]
MPKKVNGLNLEKVGQSLLLGTKTRPSVKEENTLLSIGNLSISMSILFWLLRSPWFEKKKQKKPWEIPKSLHVVNHRLVAKLSRKEPVRRGNGSLFAHYGNCIIDTLSPTRLRLDSVIVLRSCVVRDRIRGLLTTTTECIEPNEESTGSAESIESEPTAGNKAKVSSYSESQNGISQIVQWRGFSRIMKRGPTSQSLPPVKPTLTRKNSKRFRDDILPNLCSALDAELGGFKSSWTNFSLSDLQEATNNFSPENLIGEGGYAEVYKGQLKSGMFVAIKRLNRGTSDEMTIDFLSELGIIVHVDHPNIAKLIGYGVEGGMHLVLQLSPHGSLASILYGSKEKLNWQLRFKIALGAAEGLCYLHEGCQRRIIHKDIKASNILLSEDFDAQICDFGLAKWLPDQWTHHTVSKVEGTFGYLPPEFFMHGVVDEKTDVYAFGVLLLELITGRQAIDSSQQSLVMWAKPLIRENKMKELVDPVLDDSLDTDQLQRMVATASICVVDILKGTDRGLEVLKQQESGATLQRTYSEEIFDAEEYNSTKILNDLNHQMETLLEQSNDV